MNKTTVLKVFGVASLLTFCGLATSSEVEAGAVQIWRSNSEAANVASLGKPLLTMCVAPGDSKKPATLMGQRPVDFDCTATAPQQVNSVTSTFNLTCSSGKVTGVATSVKNGSRFATSIVWRGDETMTRSFVYGSRVSACK